MIPRKLVAAIRKRDRIPTPKAIAASRKAIAELRAMRDEGYEWDEIRDYLRSERLDVSVRSLQRYLSHVGAKETVL